MKPNHDQLQDFLANRPVSGVPLALNDYVNVIEGAHAGDSGSVVNLEEIGADPIYLVELESGEQLLVAGSHLQHVGES
jgi:ribosomal protein S4E